MINFYKFEGDLTFLFQIFVVFLHYEKQVFVQ